MMSNPSSFLAAAAAPLHYDIVVCGAGAAGMSAACFAALGGAKVLLIESSEHVGGTSAYSAGGAWIPKTHHSDALGIKDSIETAEHFLDQAVGDLSPRSMRHAYLRTGAEAVALMEGGTSVQWRPFPKHPDYEFELEGSLPAGRILEVVPFDTRVMSRGDRKLVRPPLPEFTILGGMQVDRVDIANLLSMLRSPKAFLHATKLVLRYGIDLALHGTSTRRLMGNALVARLLHSCRQLGVDIATCAMTSDIIQADGTVTGLRVEQAGRSVEVGVGRAVLLAGGGAARNPAWRKQYLPEGTPEFSPAAPGLNGDLQDLALRLGARRGTRYSRACFLAPVSTRMRADGTRAVFPHFVLDRSKPRVIAVNKHGRRFINEAVSYHNFAHAQLEQDHGGDTIPCYLITDAIGLRKYGLGMVRPGGWGKRAALRSGYLVSGKTLDELAGKLDISAAALTETITRYNGFSADGVDRDFGKGETVYHRHNGDQSVSPNPCIGPLEQGPFYALRLYPSDIGSALGLVTNENAQVLGEADQPIGGLYAVGNDMHSVLGGTYPAPGITLGPAVVFAYRAARHALGLTIKADQIASPVS